MVGRFGRGLVGWEGDYRRVDVDVTGIVRAVALPSLMWGLGTALGELPSYFGARAARAAAIAAQL